MTIFTKLGLGFGAVIATFAVTGALVLRNLEALRVADEHVQDRVSFNDIALEYRHGAQDASLGAAQVASGNALGAQRLREGAASMVRSRQLLKVPLTSEAERLELLELERVEKLTLATAVIGLVIDAIRKMLSRRSADPCAAAAPNTSTSTSSWCATNVISLAPRRARRSPT